MMMKPPVKSGRNPLLIYLLILLFTLVACGGDDGGDSGETTPEPNQPATFAPQEGPGGVQLTAIPPAPEFFASAGPITVANVNQAAYLGRLDASLRPTTVFAHAISPASTELAGFNNERLILWDLITGQRLWETSRQEMSFLYFSADKDELYAIALDGDVLVIDAGSGTIITDFFGNPNFTGALDYHQESGLLAMGGGTGEVKIWDVSERESLVTFDTQEAEVNVLRLSPDARLLASSGVEGIVTVWDWRNRQLIGQIDLEGATISRMAFSPDSQRLAVATTDNISLWRIHEGGIEFEYTLETGRGGATSVMHFSPDGRYLVNGGAIPEMTLWDGETGDLLALLPGVGEQRVSAAFSPDSDLLVTSVIDGGVTLWNLEAINPEAGTIGSAVLPVPSDRIVTTDWTPDGFQMLFFDAAGPVYIWGLPADASP